MNSRLLPETQKRKTLNKSSLLRLLASCFLLETCAFLPKYPSFNLLSSAWHPTGYAVLMQRI